ncbi:MAG TPA: hydantoinase B/oxoprolinase family protein [bacterium]|nr:hydantoinase B/oxoprolinase family protein [bacterium]
MDATREDTVHAGELAVDPVTLEVVNQRLQSIADEMETSLCRSAFSSIVKEAMDASSALFDRDGNTLAQAAALPGHLGMMIPAVRRILQAFPAGEMRPGDVYAFNDPYDGGTHLPDITVVAPVFWDGRVVALSVTMAHHQDVGGFAPGSTPPNVTEIFAEGLRIPPVRLYVEGQPNRDVWEILRLNTRVPDTLLGDLRAQLAAGNIGRRRLEALFEEYRAPTLLRAFDELQDYAERLTRIAIDAIPDGDYVFEDFLDHDGVERDRPLRIRATVSIRGSRFHVDFTGTDAQAKGPINSVPASTMSAVYYVVRALAGSHVPNNQGCYRCVEIEAPEGTLVNPLPPAPVGLRSYTIKRIVDVLFGALAQALPDQIPAASHGQISLMLVGGRRKDTNKLFVGFIGVPFSGGGGARPGKDGIDVVETDINNCTSYPLEACEMESPLQFERLQLWTDSGGAGTYRGGLGYVAVCRWVGGPVTFSHRRDRHNFKPWGLRGGHPAPLCRTVVVRRDGRTEELPSKILTHLDEGDLLRFYTTGGGGFGDPLVRDPDRVLEDVLDGRVSAEAARRDYGVALDGTGTRVDRAATDALRARSRGTGCVEG